MSIISIFRESNLAFLISTYYEDWISYTFQTYLTFHIRFKQMTLTTEKDMERPRKEYFSTFRRTETCRPPHLEFIVLMWQSLNPSINRLRVTRRVIPGMSLVKTYTYIVLG
jgi:hypothetical protein